MDPKDQQDIPVFVATPAEDRRIVSAKGDHKVSRPHLIPDSILKDEFLNSLIESSLPKNYNFEIHKTIWKIEQTQSKRVLLQLPEGLIRFGAILVDILSGYFRENDESKVDIITMGDLTYGACCIDDYLAESMGCDLIVHYAHSCLVPINKLSSNIKYLYIFLDIKFDTGHVVDCVKHNFNPKYSRIAIASTIQFLASAHEVAKVLKQLGYRIQLPQSRPLSTGEVLGCTAPKLDEDINTILFICDGRFHLEALMIANPKVEAFRYDPYCRKLVRESYMYDEMVKLRRLAIDKAVSVVQEGGTFGFILGTLGRQGSETVYDTLIERLRHHTECKFVKVLMPEVLPGNLNEFESVDVWVQVACPRLSIDWGSAYEKPLLNPYEFTQCIKLSLNLKDGPGDINLGNYPMDFYAKYSSSSHTPNHSCEKNSLCECSIFLR